MVADYICLFTGTTCISLPKNKVGKSLDFLTFGGLVIRLGLKPRTHSLEGCCSIQLSYRTRFFLA